MEWGFWTQGCPCDSKAFQCTTLPLSRFTHLWSWQDPWKVLSLAVHGSFTTCVGSPVVRDSNQSLVSFFLTCRWSVWMSWWIVPVWKAAWGHPELKHILWEPKMIKYSKKRPTDWLTDPFPRLPVWWQEWLSSLAFNPMSVSGVKIAHSLKWSQPARPGVRRTFYLWGSHR